MNMFENMQDKLLAIFEDWIKINDNQSMWTIEDFPYITGVCLV